MINSSLQGSNEPRICVIPYAKLDANVLASGIVPSRIDIRNPSSCLLYNRDKK